METDIHGTDPLKWDTDGDGLSDSEELPLSTDPKAADTDGDGFDGEEVASGTSALDKNEIPLGEGELRQDLRWIPREENLSNEEPSRR